MLFTYKIIKNLQIYNNYKTDWLNVKYLEFTVKAGWLTHVQTETDYNIHTNNQYPMASIKGIYIQYKIYQEF